VLISFADFASEDFAESSGYVTFTAGWLKIILEI